MGEQGEHETSLKGLKETTQDQGMAPWPPGQLGETPC